MSALREFLEHEARLRRKIGVPERWHYASLADLVLREGCEMAPAPYDAGRWGARGVAQQCYVNAHMLAVIHNPDLRYVEGYACEIIPVFHAWCIDADGRVVDPTWTGEPDRPKAAEYLGIVFPIEFILEVRGHFALLDDWENDWPLLHQPLSDLFPTNERNPEGGASS